MATNSFAFAIAPFIPALPSVKTTLAPYAFNKLRRSTLIVSGIVMIALYPLAAATDAIPIPVFPLVGSINVAPGLINPFFSASSIIFFAIRSFTLPAGLKNSTFATTLASKPSFSSICVNSTNGVFPIKSEIALYTVIFFSSY